MSGMRQKIQSTQMRLAFDADSRGEAQDAAGEGTEPLVAERDRESLADGPYVIEAVCERENLRKAWRRVRANKGGPGVDGLTIAATADYLRANWPRIRCQLLEGRSRSR